MELRANSNPELVHKELAGYTDVMKISLKLFLSLLSLTGLVLVLTLTLARWSFQQGFLDFINGMEQQRLSRMQPTILEHYRDGNFDWQGVDQSALADILSGQSPRRDSRRSRPPPERQGPKGDRKRPPPPRGQQPPPSRPGAKLGPSAPRTGLFDEQNGLIAGSDMTDQAAANFTFDIYYDGRKIAELRSWPTMNTSSELASRFAEQQLLASVGIGTFCLIIAGLLSWILSAQLLKPLNKVAKDVTQLTKGDYNIDVDEARRDELGTLMHNVGFLGQVLEKNRTAKSRLFADISHELRTPLTILTGELDLLKDGVRMFDQKSIDSLEQEVELLRHLVDDLYELSLSDVGALKYHFETTDISECMLQTLASMKDQATNKGLALTMTAQNGVTLPMDEKRMVQMFLNLCSNSIAYTDAPGNITFDLSLSNNKVIILVNDTLPSVTQDDCMKLFEPLYRQDEARTRRESGAGLGLTICKNIVEAHGGTISAEASQLGGLCIRIVFDTY